MAWLPCWPLTGQQAMKHTSKGVHAGFETQGGRHTKSKTGDISGPNRRTDVSNLYRRLASQHASLVRWPGGVYIGGVCIRWGLDRPPLPGILRDTVNERAVRILLEFILIFK